MVYQNIQGLRAVAALMVVFSHIFWPLEPLRSHWLVPFVDAVGPAGVDLFFVISGFVIYLSADRISSKVPMIGRVAAFREFVAKRLLRIYPVYWLAFAVSSFVMLRIELAPTWIEQRPWWKLALLIDQPNNRILAAWTLQFEIYFYAISAFALFIMPDKIRLALLIWVGAVFAVWLASWFVYEPWMMSIHLAPIVLEFGFGIIVALLIQRKLSEYGASAIAIGVAGFLLGAIIFKLHGGWFNLSPMWRVVCFGLPSAFVVYGFVAVEIKSGWRFSNAWVSLGDASYSLYLWHQLVFAIMAAWFVQSGLVNHIPFTFLGLSFLAVIIPLAVASYHLIEKPIMNSSMAKKIIRRTPKSG